MKRTGETEKNPVTISEEDDKEEYLNSTQNPLDECDLATLISSITGKMNNDIWINAKMSMATEIQAELNRKKKDLPLEEQIPKEFHDFLDIFSEEKAARFPESRPWDCYDFKRLRQSSTVVGSKVQVLMSLEECKS